MANPFDSIQARPAATFCCTSTAPCCACAIHRPDRGAEQWRFATAGLPLSLPGPLPGRDSALCPRALVPRRYRSLVGRAGRRLAIDSQGICRWRPLRRARCRSRGTGGVYAGRARRGGLSLWHGAGAVAGAAAARRLALGLVSQFLAGAGNRAEIDAGNLPGIVPDSGVGSCQPRRAPFGVDAAGPIAPWDAARGSLDRATSGGVSSIRRLISRGPTPISPADFIHRLRQVPALLEAGKARVLVLRGTPGSDRRQVVGAEARALGRQVIEIFHGAPGRRRRRSGCRGAARPVAGCAVHPAHALPLYTFDLGPGETADLPDLPGYAGPAAVLMGLEGGLRGDLAEQALTLVLPWPDLELRLRHWQAAFATVSAQTLSRSPPASFCRAAISGRRPPWLLVRRVWRGATPSTWTMCAMPCGRSTGRCSTAWPSG